MGGTESGVASQYCSAEDVMQAFVEHTLKHLRVLYKMEPMIHFLQEKNILRIIFLKNQKLLTPKNIKMLCSVVIAHATCGSACA